MIAVEVLMDKLNSLETATDIADFLKSQRITGDKTKAASCVITNWVKRESGVEDITTTGIVREGRWPKERKYGMSPAAVSFLGGFDRGYYPELENEISQAEY